MRVLTVRHVTAYRYSTPIELGEHRMMLRPRESHDLRLISSQLSIIPQPKDVRWVHDVFDNSVAVATFSGETTELRFESAVTLEHLEAPLPDYQLEAHARYFPFSYSSEDGPDLARALEQRHPTEDVTAWAQGFLAGAGPIETMVLLRSMTVAIHEQFIYARRVERGVQSPSETLRLKSGTCRDFALFMIEAARAIGLAARFVSGYIFVPDAEPSLAPGSGSTHAWLQIYLPGAGWVDFDPTNRIVGNRNLIRIAVAWDPQQVLPLWGTFVGPRSSFLGMDVAVSVLEIDIEASRLAAPS
jgi:transglutaminase-like putative cysteine protease